MNDLIHADNLETMRQMETDSVDLIYADPPFNTGRDFGGDEGGYTDKPGIENPRAMLNPPDDFSWIADVTTPTEKKYFEMMIPRLIEIERIIAPTGAFYLHIDWRTAPVFRLILNQIWGQARFRNEIAWMYQISMPYDTIKLRWKNNHDTILFYAGDQHNFQSQYHALTYKQIKEMYPYTDSKGEKYRYTDGLYGERQYAKDNQGTRIGTAWDDIKIAGPKERTGYPTQKPIALLERIVRASSYEGDIVLDPYCGSGTTLLAALRINRNFIGIDQNEEAIHIAKQRLK